MAHVRSWAGLDVHAAKVVAAVVDRESGELTSRRLSGRTGEVVEFCAACQRGGGQVGGFARSVAGGV